MTSDVAGFILCEGAVPSSNDNTEYNDSQYTTAAPHPMYTVQNLTLNDLEVLEITPLGISKGLVILPVALIASNSSLLV